MTFGELVLKKRMERSLSQDDAWDLTGVHASMFSRVERGTGVTLWIAMKIVKAFEITPEEFFSCDFENFKTQGKDIR